MPVANGRPPSPSRVPSVRLPCVVVRFFARSYSLPVPVRIFEFHLVTHTTSLVAGSPTVSSLNKKREELVDNWTLAAVPTVVDQMEYL